MKQLCKYRTRRALGIWRSGKCLPSGAIKGVGEDRFAPDEKVTGPEFSTMVLRAAGQEEFNWQNALNLLVEQGILSAENISTMDVFT